MDCQKTGCLIRRLRLEQNMTQQQLADALHISPKTVSKWECGLGCPDVSLLGGLSAVLGVQTETLLRGEFTEGSPDNGNMKKISFYVCPVCGSISTSTGGAQLSCCGKVLSPLTSQKAAEAEKLRVEPVEDEWFITTDHPMRKDCYISFLAFVTGDSMQLLRQYPEWELQTRLPRRRRGALYFYSTEKGLFHQYI